MSSSAAASTEEFIEVLNAEQHVDLQKLRDYARHGVQPSVRGEVWLYLLGVLSDDKSQEMTSVRSKYMEYDSLDKHNLLHEKRIRNEAIRYYQRKLIPRPLPGRTLARSSQRIALAAATQSLQSINDPSIALSAPSVAIPALNTIVTTSATTRGPNRMHDGQTQILAGIMGDPSAGLTSSNSLNGFSGDESDVLIDPEAAAANEMKRFCKAVESIVCAHLNRWKWRSVDGTVTIIEPEQESMDEVGRNSREMSTQNHNDHDHMPTISRQDHPSTSSSSSTYPITISDEFLSPQDIISQDRDRSSSISSSSSTSSFDGNQQIRNEATSKSAFPSLPREYEWAHQGNYECSSNSIAQPSLGNLNGSEATIANQNKSHQGSFIQTEYHPDLILLCSPFVKCIRSEPGMFFAFEKLMSMMDKYDAQHPLPSRIANFLTLFRTTLPELYAYFDEEEVDVIGLAICEFVV